MLLRKVLVIATVFLTSPSIAVVIDAEKSDAPSFDLVPDPNVLYQPWSGAPPHMPEIEMVPPAPPGPYLSSALSNMKLHSLNNLANENQANAGQSSLPSMHSDAPWPAKQFQPKRWVPDDGVMNYVPEFKSSPPATKRSPLYRRHPNVNRGFIPPMGYRAPANQTYMNQAGNAMPPNWSGQQRKQPPPAWNNFQIPMSNYPTRTQLQPPQQAPAVPR